MLRNIIGLFIGALALAGVATNAIAAGGTPDEAKAMIEKTIKSIQAEGKDKVIAAINTPGSGYTDRDLYVVINDPTGNTLAHATNPALVGKNMLGVKDADGKQFVKEMIDHASASEFGQVDYKWPNPVSKKVEPKTSYFKKVGDIIVIVGVYKS